MKTEKHYPEEWTNPSGKKMLTCICGNRLPCPHEKQQSTPRKQQRKETMKNGNLKANELNQLRELERMTKGSPVKVELCGPANIKISGPFEPVYTQLCGNCGVGAVEIVRASLVVAHRKVEA